MVSTSKLIIMYTTVNGGHTSHSNTIYVQWKGQAYHKQIAYRYKRMQHCKQNKFVYGANKRLSMSMFLKPFTQFAIKWNISTDILKLFDCLSKSIFMEVKLEITFLSDNYLKELRELIIVITICLASTKDDVNGWSSISVNVPLLMQALLFETSCTY